MLFEPVILAIKYTLYNSQPSKIYVLH